MHTNKDLKTGAAMDRPQTTFEIDSKEESPESPGIDDDSADVEDYKHLDNYALSEDIQETVCLLTPGGKLKLGCSKTGDPESNTFKILLRYRSNEVTEGFCLNIDKIDEYWVEALADLLNNNNVTQISGLYDETQTKVKILAEALKENASLTILDLWFNNIGKTEAKALADALKDNTSLTSLDLRDNNIGDTGAEAFADALKENASLTCLDLKYNKIGDTGAEALAEALKKNASLTILNLWVNKIGDTGAKALAEALKKNISLTSLHFWINKVGDEGAEALAEALKENTSLTSLDLLRNNIGDTGAEAILAALQVNTTLTDIKLSGVFNKLKAQIEIDAALAANRLRKEANIEDSVAEMLGDNTENPSDPDMDILGNVAVEEPGDISQA